MFQGSSRPFVTLAVAGAVAFLAAVPPVALGAERTVSYVYDDADRLVEVSYGDGIRIQFTYDAAGNLLERRVVTGGPGTIELGADSWSVDEGDGSVTVTVRRVGGADGAVSVHYETADGTATGGTDYLPASGELAWADGEGSDRTVAVSILDDLLAEEDETFTVTLSSPGGGASLGGTSSALVTIVDDDQTSPTALLVPVIAHLEGVGGTPWRSDAALSNGTGSGTTLSLEYHPGPGEEIVRELALAPGESVLFEDVVSTLFGQGEGRGPLLVVSPPGQERPAVLSRTFAIQDGGNLGQGVPAVVPRAAGAVYLTGLFHDASFRSNVAVAAAGERVTATFDLLRGSDGEVVTGVEASVEAYTQSQWSVESLFPGQAQEGVPMTVRVTLSAPGVAYASLVDNLSADAATYLAEGGGTSWVVPVVAHIPGVDQTFWESDVGIASVGDGPVTIGLEYLSEGEDNSGGGLVAEPVELGPGSTVVLSDVARNLFGVEDGKGVLRVTATGDVVVTSRVYTARPGGGTSGHGVSGVDPGAFSAGARTLPGVRMAQGFRTNLGFVTADEGARLALTLRDADGSVLATSDGVAVPPSSLLQVGAASLFAGAEAPFPVGSVEVTTTAPVLSYVVIVDSSSQDPAYSLQGPPEAAR